MVYLGNAFSLQMIPSFYEARIIEVSVDEVKRLLTLNKFISIVGHEDTARILSDILKVEVSYNRQAIILQPGDLLLVGQYSGGRLPEGTIILPEEEKQNFRWFICQVNEK